MNTIIVVTHDVTAACSVADHWLMGRETAVNGEKIPGSGIVKEYNLVDRNLRWHPGILTKPVFMDFVREVKEDFPKLLREVKEDFRKL